MKKIQKLAALMITGILLVSSNLVIASHLAIGGEEESSYNIVLNYSFETPQLEEIEVFGETFTRVQLSGCDLHGKPGEPKLPAKIATILLPPQTTVKDISVEAKGRTELTITPNVELGETTFFSLPMDGPLESSGIVISQDAEGQPTITPLEEFSVDQAPPVARYNIESQYPQTIYRNQGVQYKRGYPILSLSFYPVQYTGKTHTLSYYNELDVTIMTEKDSSLPLNEFYRGLPRDEELIRDMVDNPSTLSFYEDQASSDGTYGLSASSDIGDMLIITTEALKNAPPLPLSYNLQDLKQAHEDQGMSVTIKTMEEINGDIDGAIRDAYDSPGTDTDYVLLVGDDDWEWESFAGHIWRESNIEDINEVPTKLVCLYTVYIIEQDGGIIKTIYVNTTSDVPYTCFDGEDDFYAEVYIGRAPVDTYTDLSNFVRKTIAYMQSDYTDLNALFVGERIGAGGIMEYAADSLEEMRDGSSNHYITTGIPPSSKYTINTLYEKYGWPERDLETGEGGWPKGEIINLINNKNAHILNHLGHANPKICMKLEKYDSPQLRNTEYGIWYSQGCFAAAFDCWLEDWYEDDCIGEYFTAKGRNGAAAFIGNTWYGYGIGGSTDGLSQRYCRQFWDAIFREGYSTLGEANQHSKEDNILYIRKANRDSDEGNRFNFFTEGDYMRWLYYGINLLGDPALRVKGATEKTDNQPPNMPSTTPHGLDGDVYTGVYGFTGVSYSFSTSTTDPDNHDMYYLFSWGDSITTRFPEDNGYISSGTEVSANHIWIRPGTYYVKVMAEDVHGARRSSRALKVVISQSQNKPSKPSGQTSGKINIEYNYTSNTTNPFYLFKFDWGDGTDSGWLNKPIDSTVISASHTWTQNGSYRVKVKTKDMRNVESDWSDPLIVTIGPKDRSTKILCFNFLQRLTGRFPLLVWLFQFLAPDRLSNLR